jgi:glycosyltransferase involved in cell wall biosynthesis
MSPQISVVIPCYEMGGMGSEILEYSFNKIVTQTFRDFETVITDHSKDNKIEKLCESWKDVINIKYFRNENKIGSPTANTNLSIEKSSGKIIKLLCQDDYFFNEQSIQIIVDHFTDDVNWMATSYVHTKDRINLFNKHVPKISDDIILKNLLGTPSAFTIRNGLNVWFDENLIWAYDVDFYALMIKKYGFPKVIDSITMVNFLWKGQVTNTLANEDLRRKENEYVLRKFKNA